MTDINKMREAFEKWAKMRVPYRALKELDDEGEYDDQEVRMMWCAWQAAQSVPVVGEPVEWQYRWLNPEEFTGQPASLLEWQRVIPYLSQSNEKRLEELLAYRSHGKACYEIRALVVQPTYSIAATELERLRKDAENWRNRHEVSK